MSPKAGFLIGLLMVIGFIVAIWTIDVPADSGWPEMMAFGVLAGMGVMIVSVFCWFTNWLMVQR